MPSRAKRTGLVEPEPVLVLLGCQGWTNQPHRYTDPADYHRCQVCRDNRPPPGVVCGKCVRLSRRAAAFRDAAVSALNDRDRQAEGLAAHKAENPRPPRLTESERRRYWLGANKRAFGEGKTTVLNRAAAGRQWLTEIGQLPDWSLVLDRKGNVIGRIEFTPETFDEPVPPAVDADAA